MWFARSFGKADSQGFYSNCNFNSISVQVWIELPYVPTKSFGQPLKPPAMWTNPTRLLQVQKLFRSLAVSHTEHTGPIRFIRSFLDNQMKHHCGTKRTRLFQLWSLLQGKSTTPLKKVPTDHHLPNLSVFHVSTKAACVRCCVNGISVIDVSQSQTASRTAWGRLQFLNPAKMAQIHSF